MSEFYRQQFMGDYPGPTPEEIELAKIAADYLDACEAYDRSVCTGRIVRGEIMPATSHERSAIERHARHARKAANERAASLGFNSKMLSKAIAREVDLRFRYKGKST